MNRQQEFRKQTEEAKLEAFSLMCKKVTELEAEVKEWKDKADLWCKTANLKDHNIMINKELEKENADLQKSYEELYNSMRVIKDQRNVLEKENAELRKRVNELEVINEKSK